MKHDPQNKILAYLKAGGRLTVRKAERLYHTTELRRIISRLRKMGYSICSTKQKAVTEDGRPTQFNEYYMPQVAEDGIEFGVNPKKSGVSYHSTGGICLRCAINRHPYTKGLGLFGIYYLPIFTDVLAKYEFIQLTAFGLKRFHENTSFLCGLAAN